MSERANIRSTGRYVPDNVVTNDDLAKLMTTSDEWIQQRSGVRERRYANAVVSFTGFRWPRLLLNPVCMRIYCLSGLNCIQMHLSIMIGAGR